MKTDSKTLIIGNYCWSVGSRALYHKKDLDNGVTKESLTLTQKQYDLLLCLYNAHPVTMDKESIVNAIWGSRPISAESLPQIITRTRQLLEDNDKSIIVNKPGVGYMLNFSTYENVEKCIIDEASKAETHENETKTKNPLWRIVFTVLIIMTIFQSWRLGSAIHYKNLYMDMIFHTPYPYIEKKPNSKDIIVTLDKHECIYTQGKQLLSCK
ncbi:hypothetical protein ABT56_07475 [Photobacterium aquae]|uniref:OmpR/PhoB-type domain-containing protein n=1 Tax=Photobacterium aquae TaxID=1195763 RepID=A0A0J1H5H8_9GAMM|nr:helix-turn-helix domain-containing protein [Photobacterium aquae]KLV06980.1 hypothetical protein ABT56_07475 [Photobacterium aquae]